MSPSDARAVARVVLVEDDVALSAALRFLLEVEGFAVENFESAEDLLAWTESAEGEIACVVLDQQLGAGMTGAEALERLRAQDIHAPAILITTDARPAVRRRVEAAGGIVMEKPILGDRLVRTLRSRLPQPPGNTRR